MSFKAAAWAIQQKPKLATEKLILIGLSDFHNKENNRCDPSMMSLADIGLCSERTAIRSIESLEKQGFISTIKSLGKRTKYSLNLPKTSDTHVTRDKMSPVTPVTQTPDTQCSKPLTPMSPEPGINQEEPGINIPSIKKSKFKYNESHEYLANKLAQPVQLSFPKQQINIREWADAIRKLLDIDKYSVEQIRYLWNWRTNHQGNGGFSWADNCRTPMKLRQRKDGLSYFEIMINQIKQEQPHANQINNGADQPRKLSMLDRVKQNCREDGEYGEPQDTAERVVAETSGDVRL